MVELQSVLFYNSYRVNRLNIFVFFFINFSFSRSNRFSCLNNRPKKNQFRLDLPGYANDLDEQCQRAFGSKFRFCNDLKAQCSRLYCQANASICVTNHAHWADGTVCSDWNDRRRCLRGQCRDFREIKTIDGQWGEWSDWSSCTRTCGSAVQKSWRTCDRPRPENGGRYCSGQPVRIRACETNPVNFISKQKKLWFDDFF